MRICFCSFCGSVGALLHLLTELLLFVVSKVLLSFMKASTVIVSIRKSCIFTFYHVSAGRNTSRWWKNFGPDMPLLFKSHEICSVDFRKIVKIVATRCHILSLKCTKIDFGWGSAPDPAGGAYNAPPELLAGFKGTYF